MLQTAHCAVGASMSWPRWFASAAGEHAICSFMCPTILWIIGLGFLDMQPHI